MIAMSETTIAIAYILGVVPKTVEYHRTCLMHRLGIFDVAGLTREAVRIGLISAYD